jgi:hypothetical protein
VSDVLEARRKAEQFATYWYGERATVTRLEQHDPIELTPLASSEASEASEAPAGGGPVVDAYAWTAIVHPPQGFAARVAIVCTPSGWYGFPVGQVGA